MLVKANALDAAARGLARKRVKGYIGTGSMNDPYMPLERHARLTRGRWRSSPSAVSRSTC